MKIRPSIPVFMIAASLLSAPVVLAQEGNAPTRDEDRYGTCMTAAENAPDKAINMALEWAADGGGVPARHCEAFALAKMGEYGEAAARMMLIAEDMRVGKDMPVRGGKRLTAPPDMLADMYDQAANAWLLAGEFIRAADAIEMGLAVAKRGTQQELDLRLDRARISAADGDYALALQDLDHVLQGDPGRKDILVLVAAAARGTANYIRAEEALRDYLETFPDSPSGHLELGNLRHAEGDKASARQAWLKVLQLEEDGKNADAARTNLEKMDLKLDPAVEEATTP